MSERLCKCGHRVTAHVPRCVCGCRTFRPAPVAREDEGGELHVDGVKKEPPLGKKHVRHG